MNIAEWKTDFDKRFNKCMSWGNRGIVYLFTLGILLFTNTVLYTLGIIEKEAGLNLITGAFGTIMCVGLYFEWESWANRLLEELEEKIEDEKQNYKRMFKPD